MFEALLVGQDFSYHGFQGEKNFGDQLVDAYWEMQDRKIPTLDCCNRYHLFIRSAPLLKHVERMSGFKGFLNDTTGRGAARLRRDVRGEFHGMIIILGAPDIHRNCETGLGR